MNLETGHYFSARGTGCTAWNGLLAGASVDEVTVRVAPDEARAAEVRGHLLVFVDELLSHGLLLVSDHPPMAPSLDWPQGAPGPYEPPAIQHYTDMEELLLLDPIHDVGAEGWPEPLNSAALVK